MMNWYSTLIKWEGYAEKLYPLRDEVSDIFKTKYIWGNLGNCEERHYEVDNDTAFLLKLLEKLNVVQMSNRILKAGNVDYAQNS